MEEKKRVTILVIIALILAITAITLSISSPNEIPTTGNVVSNHGGQVGIIIQPTQVEDKLIQNQETPQQ